VRKSALILEQPHPGNTSEKMEHYEIKVVYMTGQSLLMYFSIHAAANQPGGNLGLYR